MFDEIQLVSTYWSVQMPNLASSFRVFIASTYPTQSVPSDLLEEAARIDGASEAGIFWRIGFPIMTPALVSVFHFQSVAIWSNYVLLALLIVRAGDPACELASAARRADPRERLQRPFLQHPAAHGSSS